MQATAPDRPAPASWDALPPLERDQAFWALNLTQFLGAFNDNMFKQMLLLLAVAIKAPGGQGLTTVIFSLPFVLASGYAGYLSDRYSKRRIIVLSKVAEIVVMALGLTAFLFTGWYGLLFVLLLMGTQSTFFGPGKYGILPELFRPWDLPKANGIILMTTFLAIIFGTASAGGLLWLLRGGDPAEEAVHRLWIGSLVCIAIAVAGTITSLGIRVVRPANENLRLEDWTGLFIPRETRELLAQDRPLWTALLATCAFWLVSGIAIQVVNLVGMEQLRAGEFYTSILVASIGLGIALGAVLAGRLCRGRADFRLVRVGSWLIVALLIGLAIWAPGGRLLLGYGGSLVGLVLLGGAAAFFSIPLNVFIQQRPPREQKGRLIATMNFLNFFAILFSGVLFGLFDTLRSLAEWPPSAMFAMMALLMLSVAIGYRPQNSHHADSIEPQEDRRDPATEELSC